MGGIERIGFGSYSGEDLGFNGRSIWCKKCGKPLEIGSQNKINQLDGHEN